MDEHLNSHNTPFKFNAKELDDETGNYYYGARYYNPKWSTWLSVDPLVEETMDAYGYCYQNPINFVDPMGLSGEDPQSEKQKALGAINTFRNDQSTTTVWNNINKADFLNDLENIVNNPRSIDQSNTNLCGIVAPLMIFAEQKPIEFVEMALQLYQNGTYKNLNSNGDLHGNSPTNGLNNAEYVLMTSLKNGLNSSGYNPQTDSGVSGMTMPKDVDRLMGIFGFQKVNGSLNDINNKNYSSILLVNWDGLKSGTNGKIKNGTVVNLPTHYIMTYRFNILPNGNYDIGFSHWGRKVNNLQVTPANFNKMVHGLGIFK